MGDAEDGFSLCLQAGVPHFAVRVKGALHEAVAPEAVVLDRWFHVAGVIDPKGGLTLLLDTWPAVQSPGSLLARASGEPLTVGADTGSFVGGYSSPLPCVLSDSLPAADPLRTCAQAHRPSQHPKGPLLARGWPFVRPGHAAAGGW